MCFITDHLKFHKTYGLSVHFSPVDVFPCFRRFSIFVWTCENEINEVSIDPEKPHRATLKDVFHSFHVVFFLSKPLFITWLPHCRLKFFLDLNSLVVHSCELVLCRLYLSIQTTNLLFQSDFHFLEFFNEFLLLC